jgi:hypothetical protein
MTSDYEAMTLADLVESILAGGVRDYEYREEFARRVRPQDWPAGDPVQAVLARIREQEPTGDTARLLAVADLAAGAHSPRMWGRQAKCSTCPDGFDNGGDHELWPCDPYLSILLALGGVQQPVQAEVVQSRLRPRAGRASLAARRGASAAQRIDGHGPHH